MRRPDDVELEYPPTPVEALQWIAESDYLVLRGGIQAADGETTVNPGCCADLEGWRGWPDVWLGHDPAPRIERTADTLLVRQEQGSQDSVKVAGEALPGLLAGLREDLTGFLAAAERWAAVTATDADPALVAAVITNIDRHVGITAPLSGAATAAPTSNQP